MVSKSEFFDTADRDIARLCRRYKNGEFALSTFRKKVLEIMKKSDPSSRPIYEERVKFELGRRLAKLKEGA